MTCQELRLHFEDLRRMAASQQPDCAEIAAHTAICTGCSRFVEGQGELATKLSLLLDAAPEVPLALEAKVIADYRTFAARPVSATRLTTRRRISLSEAFAWAAAVVATVIIAGVALRLFFPSEEISTESARVTTPQVQPAPKSTAPLLARTQRPNASSSRVATVAKAKRKPTAAAEAVAREVAQSETPNVVSTNSADPLPEGFRSLMYCDALSCGGPMEMIRVQLPPSAAGLAPAWSQTNGIVYADVLVGPDGIARGIRIVQ